MNPEIQKSTQEIGEAVAYHGKKVITSQPEGLPFQIQGGVPTYKGEKVRVDVVPCKNNCS